MTRTGGDDAAEFWRALAEAYAAGADLDWTRVSGGRYPVVDLPSTPFERRSFWMRGESSEGVRPRRAACPARASKARDAKCCSKANLSTPLGELAGTALAGLVAAGLEDSGGTRVLVPRPHCRRGHRCLSGRVTRAGCRSRGARRSCAGAFRPDSEQAGSGSHPRASSREPLPASSRSTRPRLSAPCLG